MTKRHNSMEGSDRHATAEPESQMTYLTKYNSAKHAFGATWLTALFLFAACTSSQGASTNVDPRAGDYVLESGSNSIDGRAFLVSRTGDEHTCERDGVSLMPVTPHSSQFANLLFSGRSNGYAEEQAYISLQPADDFWSNSRHKACDESGHFLFERVADGKYFVFSNITWSVRFSRAGGVLMKTVEVDGAAHPTVVLQSTLAY